MSFESRFAAFGRFLDDVADWLRDRLGTARPSFDTRVFKDAVSDTVSRAYDTTRHAVADQGSRLMASEHRARFGTAAIVILCVIATAVITRWVSSGDAPPADNADAHLLRSIAASRDAQRGEPGPPRPIRAEPAPAGARGNSAPPR